MTKLPRPLTPPNPHQLRQRWKQIDIGKNTLAYDEYSMRVPRHLRDRSNRKHPVTPNPHTPRSKRAFDGLVRAWRRDLYAHWQPIQEEERDESEAEPEAAGPEAAEPTTSEDEFWKLIKSDRSR